jgi:Ca2+-binding RTX toxin-like protein
MFPKKMLSVAVGAIFSVSTVFPVAAFAVTPVTYTCGGRTATLVGTPGNDVLFARRSGEVIVGLEGNDTISATRLTGASSYVIICGNQGNDNIYGSDGPDQLYGGQGDDKMYGRGGSDYMEGKKGDDFIDGNAGSDIQFGNEGNDELYSSQTTQYGPCGIGFDADRMYGGEGNDIVAGGFGADHLEGNLGIDLVHGGLCSDVCTSGERYYGCESTSVGVVPLPQ